MKKIWLFIAWPLSAMYGIILWFRNALYLSGLIRRVSFNVPVIAVGNLIAGGSGKTPMVLYLISRLSTQRKLAVLSRGYGRETRSFRWVNTHDLAIHTGDESLMIKQRFPEVLVAVCESRVEGVKRMLNEFPDIDSIILDDAFQHLHILPAQSILLTTYQRPYFRDYPFPAGLLREFRTGSKRADAIVVTKCPNLPDNTTADQWKKNLKVMENQQLFFAQYHNKHITQVQGEPDQSARTLLITGIAHPQILVDFVKSKWSVDKHYAFNDHHKYGLDTFRNIKTDFPGNVNVITTEKDWVKWTPYLSEIVEWNILMVIVEVQIDRPDEFDGFLNRVTVKNKAR